MKRPTVPPPTALLLSSSPTPPHPWRHAPIFPQDPHRARELGLQRSYHPPTPPHLLLIRLHPPPLRCRAWRSTVSSLARWWPLASITKIYLSLADSTEFVSRCLLLPLLLLLFLPSHVLSLSFSFSSSSCSFSSRDGRSYSAQLQLFPGTERTSMADLAPLLLLFSSYSSHPPPPLSASAPSPPPPRPLSSTLQGV